jgi:hypothetical protein
VELRLAAPEGTELAEAAPLHVQLEVSRRSDLLHLPSTALTLTAGGGISQLVRLPVHVTELPEECIEAELVVSVDYLACGSGEKESCWPRNVRIRVPVRLLAASGQSALEFEVSLPALDK